MDDLAARIAAAKTPSPSKGDRSEYTDLNKCYSCHRDGLMISPGSASCWDCDHPDEAMRDEHDETHDIAIAHIALPGDIKTKLTKAQIDLVTGEVPLSAIRVRVIEGSGATAKYISYIPIDVYEDYLNHLTGWNWWPYVDKEETVDRVCRVYGGIAFVLPDGTERKIVSYGSARIDRSAGGAWGDAMNTAVTNMIKKAATRLGIGRRLKDPEVQRKVMESHGLVQNPDGKWWKGGGKR